MAAKLSILHGLMTDGIDFLNSGIYNMHLRRTKPKQIL
jgi:hypothetical protein